MVSVLATAAELKLKGNAAFDAENFEEAMTIYTEGIEAVGDSDTTLKGTLFSNRSACNLHLGKPDLALADAEVTIELRPTWPRGYLRKATALALTGKFDESLEAAGKGLELDPNDESLVNVSQEIEAMKKNPGIAKLGGDADVLRKAQEMLEGAGIKEPLPVTVLSGFLGAGKTTLLNRILTEEHGKRLAVIVNDMAGVNVDAELVKKTAQKHGLSNVEEELIEMSNGCVCCTLRGDLIQESARLVAEGKYDSILIEASGISEPMPVAATYTTEDSTGATLEKYFRIDNMVTVVDGSRFYADIKSAKSLKDANMEAYESDERTIAHLLIDQIEFASTILLNKMDLITPEAAKELESVLKELNPKAKLIRTERSNAPIADILDTKRFDMETAHAIPGFDSELKTYHTPETEEYGIGSVVFKSKRPFHPKRLYDVIYAAAEGKEVDKEALSSATGSKKLGAGSYLNNTLRSKGFFYMADNIDICLEWSMAGASCAFSMAGQWMCASLPEKDWPLDSPEWDKTFGDRQQKIVLIGNKANVVEMKKILETCVLTDEEVVLGQEKWKEFGAAADWEIDEHDHGDDMDEEDEEESDEEEEEDDDEEEDKEKDEEMSDK